MGYNNNILPTPHTYWETCESWLAMRLNLPCNRGKRDLLAPGSGRVTDVLSATDGFIVVEGPPGFSWHFGHVTPAAGIARGDTIIAGTVIATMAYDHGFDFGAIHMAVTHRHIRPERFSHAVQHGQHPIAQFPEPLRSQLLTRMNPAGPQHGRLQYDSIGTMAGTWLLQGKPVIYLTRETDSLLVWFGRWTERQETRVVTFGQIPAGAGNRLLVADSSAPDWERITEASGPVAVRLWNLNVEARANLSWPGGTLLVQVTGPKAMRMQWFPTHDPVSGFTTAARDYER